MLKEDENRSFRLKTNEKKMQAGYNLFSFW